MPAVVLLREASGSVIVAGTAGEMMTPAENVVKFSRSSKRTISAMPRLLFPVFGPAAVEFADRSMEVQHGYRALRFPWHRERLRPTSSPIR